MRIYLDVVFVLNLMINYLLLLVSARVAGEPFRRLWLLVGSALGAMASALLFLPGLEWLFHPLCRVGLVLVMLLAAYWYSARFFKLGAIFFALSCMLGGGVLILSLLAGKGIQLSDGVLSTGMDLKAAALTMAVCYVGMDLLLRRTGRHNGGELLPVTVSIGGKQIFLTALQDNGNTLADPATGRPVLVAEGAGLRGMIPESLLAGLEHPTETMEGCGDALWRQRLRLLPYRAVGVRCGFLLAVRADRVQVDGREYGGLLVALSPTPVSDGGRYQALFGG